MKVIHERIQRAARVRRGATAVMSNGKMRMKNIRASNANSAAVLHVEKLASEIMRKRGAITREPYVKKKLPVSISSGEPVPSVARSIPKSRKGVQMRKMPLRIFL